MTHEPDGTGVVDLGDLSGGADLSDAVPADLGTAAAGTSELAARADHVHKMPTAAQVGAATAEEVSQLKNEMVTLTEGEETPGEAPALNAGTFGGMTVAQFVDMIYPVGSIYMSASATSPESLFGGTWESIGGRFLLGADATYTAGSTGGEATHTLTVSEMPNHYHHCPIAFNTSGGNRAANADWSDNAPAADNSQSKSSSTGDSKPHNNMPPYLAVYMWQRTA